MARFQDHQKALALRQQGMSYSQIKKKLRISKSTLSCWLKDHPLSKKRIGDLRDRNESRIEKFRKTMQQKKEKRLKDFYVKQKKFIFPLCLKELYLAGLFLYWGEGTKGKTTSLSVSNTDPSVIKFFIFWLVKSLGVSREKLKVQLHLYSDMQIQQEVYFWSKVLDIPKKQFNKPYIKKSSLQKINHRGGFGHGTCNVSIGDARLSEQILMAIKSIADKYFKSSK